MAFMVVTAGTVFFQNSTQPTAAIQSVPQATPAPPPIAEAPGGPSGSLPGLHPLPAAASPVAAARVAAPAELASTAEEFRQASEPFLRVKGRRVEPEAATVLASGEKNLAEARAELAKGDNRKAEEFLKLVRSATERLKKN